MRTHRFFSSLIPAVAVAAAFATALPEVTGAVLAGRAWRRPRAGG